MFSQKYKMIFNYFWRGFAIASVAFSLAEANAQAYDYGAFASTDAYTCLRNFYVSPNGSDSNSGTSEASAFRTIQHAVGQSGIRAGDCVNVLPGTYTEILYLPTPAGASDSSAGYFVLRSTTRYGAKVRPPSGAYSTVNMASYNIVDGLDVQGGGGHAIQFDFANFVKVLNCLAHDSQGGGIMGQGGDYVLIQGNIARNNSASNGFQTSGISIYRPVAVNTKPGFHLLIRNNISNSNAETKLTNTTDGNGIIMDTFDLGTPPYTQATLIENNLTYNNGGKGVHVFYSHYVTVRNNFAWKNNWDPNNPGTWRAELSNANGSDNVWEYNIGVADPSTNSNNVAIFDDECCGSHSLNTVWQSNISFDGKAGDPSVQVGVNSHVDASMNKLGVDPMFTNPSTDPYKADFSLRASSPALALGIKNLPWDWSRVATQGYPDPISASSSPAPTPDPTPTPTPTPTPVSPAPAPVCGSVSLLNSMVPSIVSDPDTQKVELGVKLQAMDDAVISGLRFYKGSQNQGPHTGHIYAMDGSVLATVSFVNESSSGWQVATLNPAVRVTKGDMIIASYIAPVGNYAADVGGFNQSVTDSAGLFTAPIGAGVYQYGGGFPTSNYENTNYYVDVVADRASCSSQDSSVTSPTPSPQPVATDLQLSIADGQVFARRTTVQVQAQISSNVGIQKVEFYVNGALKKTDSSAPYSYSFNSGWRRRTLQITVKAYDAQGNVTSKSVSIQVK